MSAISAIKVPLNHESGDQPSLLGFGLSGLDTIEHEALARAVYVDTKDEFGSGVVVETNIVLTTLHYLEKADEIRVNGVKARLLHSSKRMDLAALWVAMNAVPPVRFVGTRLHEEVLYAGYIRRLKTMVLARGEVTFQNNKVVCSTPWSEEGTCGGGLWTQHGLAGLLDSDDQLGLTLAISRPILQRFLSAVHRKVSPMESQPTQGSLLFEPNSQE